MCDGYNQRTTKTAQSNSIQFFFTYSILLLYTLLNMHAKFQNHSCSISELFLRPPRGFWPTPWIYVIFYYSLSWNWWAGRGLVVRGICFSNPRMPAPTPTPLPLNDNVLTFCWRLTMENSTLVMLQHAFKIAQQHIRCHGRLCSFVSRLLFG